MLRKKNFFNILSRLYVYESFKSLKPENRVVICLLVHNMLYAGDKDFDLLEVYSIISESYFVIKEIILLAICLEEYIEKFNSPITRLYAIMDIYIMLCKYRDTKCIVSDFREINNYGYYAMNPRYIYRLGKNINEILFDLLVNYEISISDIIETSSFGEQERNKFKLKKQSNEVCKFCNIPMTMLADIKSCSGCGFLITGNV